MDRVKGPWSPDEDEALQRLVQKHGPSSPVPPVRYRLVSHTSPRTRSADPSLLSDRFSSPFMPSPEISRELFRLIEKSDYDQSQTNVSVSEPSQLGVTALHWAAALGCSKACEALLFCELGGLDIETKDPPDMYGYSQGMRGIRKKGLILCSVTATETWTPNQFP